MPIAKPFLFLLSENWDSESLIAKIKTVPILFLSGAQDEMVPSAHMKALYNKCGSKNKTWMSFPNGTHNDTVLQEEYFTTVANWIRSEILHRIGSRKDAFDPTNVDEVSIKLKSMGVEAGSRAPNDIIDHAAK